MDALLPNIDLTRASDLYGKYKNIRQKTVCLYGGVSVQYYLLKGMTAERGEDVYSILCVEQEDGVVTDSEFVFDICKSRSGAEHIYDVLCRNTVTPCCLFDVIDNVLYDLLK